VVWMDLVATTWDIVREKVEDEESVCERGMENGRNGNGDLEDRQ
jgi:hypothetical protein